MDSQAPVFITRSYTCASKGASRKLYITWPTQKQVRDCHVITQPLHLDSTKTPIASGRASTLLGEVNTEPVSYRRLFNRSLTQFTRQSMIEEALRQTGGNKQKAAQVLGLSRQGLIKKLKRLGIGAI